MKPFFDSDWIILICALFLCGIGAAIIGSVAQSLLLPQIFFYILGLALFFLFSRLDFRIYNSLSRLLYLGSLVLLLLTLFIGLETRGSVRWITVASFRLQFSEIAKPFLVTALAAFFLDQKRPADFVRSLFLLILPVLFVFKQPDLGSALVYFVSFMAVLFSTGVNLSYFLGILALGLISLPLGWNSLAAYQKNRILSFLNPGVDPLGVSYNAIQAVIAIGSGMLLGRGLGRGTQSHLLFLPEHHTDFIFASVAEELGFLGAAFVLALYFVLIWRIFTVALKSKDKYATAIAVGIGVLILSQVFINVGMNLGLFPVTGITLPLISYGGSSVLATMIGLGIVENIAQSLKSADKIVHIV